MQIDRSWIKMKKKRRKKDDLIHIHSGVEEFVKIAMAYADENGKIW